MATNSIKIGIVQENPIVGDISGNTKLAIKAINALKEDNLDIILFTEMFLTGYPPEDLLLRDDLLESIDDAIKELSLVAKNTHLVIGYPRKKGNNLFNTAGVIFQGELSLEYFKQELPNYRVFDEKRYFVPGKGPGIFQVKGKNMALTVCEDIWHTKAIRQASRRGADLVLNLNASPFHRNKRQERKTLLEDHANKFQIPIVYANQVGGQDELVFDGASMVVCPNTGLNVQLDSFKVETRVVEFFENNERLLETKYIKTEERKDLEDVYDALVLGARDYIKKNGFPGAIIGSSGGIDSALTAAIVADALGPDNLKTYMMPYKYTADMSVEDAQELAHNLGIEHNIIGIEDIFNAFYNALEEEFSGKKLDKTEENLQSRCRGVLLMALSNKTGSLVMTTGNKSETAVGYSTLYGDTAGGFAVLKDVPKTLVYELAKYRNSLSKTIPQRIIDRPPSAELAPDQKDSDSLPDYDVLDAIIELYVERDKGKKEIVKEGFDEAVVRRIIRLIDISEYKRRQGPLGVKITERGFGKDRRYPITNRYSQ
jgi:NAD+ synthase (glutamine-hydrolysing)